MQLNGVKLENIVEDLTNLVGETCSGKAIVEIPTAEGTIVTISVRNEQEKL